MKKLSLKNLKLEADDMLQRNQLKSVLGGYGHTGDGPNLCPNEDEAECICDFGGFRETEYHGCQTCDRCAYLCSSC